MGDNSQSRATRSHHRGNDDQLLSGPFSSIDQLLKSDKFTEVLKEAVSVEKEKPKRKKDFHNRRPDETKPSAAAGGEEAFFSKLLLVPQRAYSGVHCRLMSPNVA